MSNAFKVVKDFEKAICDYTGAPYCVTVNSCTNALFLALEYQSRYYRFSDQVEIPKHTYVSVPMQIKHTGFNVAFRDEDWSGIYQLKPFPIWDSARRFTSYMYTSLWDELNNQDLIMCVSFHWAKILGIQQGGAILHNSYDLDQWARRARFDGRTEGVAPLQDEFTQLGWHMYMSPEIAAEGLVRLAHLKHHNPDLPNDEYPDLSKMELFK